MSGLATYGTKSTTPANAGTFAGGATGGSFSSQLQAIQTQVDALPPGQFAADYGISSTELPTYYVNGQFTLAAYSLAYYDSLSQGDRQAIQDQMVTAGLMPASAATGLRGGASLTAFKDLAGVTSAQNTDPFDWLSTNATPLNQIQTQISANLTAAEKAVSAPEVASVTNQTTNNADLTAAFEQALGYSPDQKQLDAFNAGIQSQEVAAAGGPRAAAQGELNAAKTETAALDAMGPDDVDKVIAAYQAAVSGSGLPGAGTTQGPATGPLMGNVPQGHDFQGATAQVGANVQPTGTTTSRTTQVAPGILAQAGHALGNVLHSGTTITDVNGRPVLTPGTPPSVGTPDNTQTTQRTTYRAPSLGAVPALTGGMWSGSTYGGTYALSQADWTQALKDLGATGVKYKKLYATPGSAPQSVQQAAFSALLVNAYDTNGGSWSAAISAIASGTPFGQAKGTHLTAFGNQVASQVNAQIAALQNQVNNSPVTVKVSQPDITAEANLAAKQSDPTGYEAAQVSSWGQELNQMLQGSPQYYNNASTDTFTGPVGAGLATGTPSVATSTPGSA